MPNDLKPLKILVLLAGYIKNDSRVLRHIRYFQESGLAVSLLSFDRDAIPVLPLSERILWPGFGTAKRVSRSQPRKTSLFYFLKLIAIFYFNWRAYWLLRRRPFDFFYANDFDALPAGVWLAGSHKAPVFYDSHELYADQQADVPAVYRHAIMYFEKRFVKQAAKVLTVTPSIARELQKRYHLSSTPVVILNVPVYSDRGRSSPKKSFSVLYHGVLIGGRGLKELVLAMQYLPRGHLTLRGNGKLKSYLQGLVQEYRLQDRVSFEEPVAPPDVITAASEFEIGVTFLEPNCKNHQFALPNKLFQYLHAGLAVISNDITEVQAVLQETQAGMTIPAIEPRSIAEAISSLLDDPKTLKQFQANAERAAKMIFNFDLEKEKLKALFNNVIRKERPLVCAES